MERSRRAIANALQAQSAWCERLGSPLYARLLARAAEDAEQGGPAWAILARHSEDPAGSALALRFMAAVHRLVLVGDAPDLARFYPSAAERPADDDAWPAFRATLAARPARIRDLVDRPCQTNEVGRSGALVGGFLVVAAEERLPLRVLEIGSSGGLNLRWDHYRYEAEDWAWGDPASPVRFTGLYEGASRPPSVPVEVVERAGCDADPVDVASEDGRLTLMASTWPDQARRFPHLRGALEVAARVHATVEQADAASWLGVRLAERTEGVATVVFHSIVMQYLGREGRDRVREVIAEAGRRATPRAPLARLRLEPTGADPSRGEFLVHLETWPGGEERLLARAHPHGPPVQWFVSATATGTR